MATNDEETRPPDVDEDQPGDDEHTPSTSALPSRATPAAPTITPVRLPEPSRATPAAPAITPVRLPKPTRQHADATSRRC